LALGAQQPTRRGPQNIDSLKEKIVETADAFTALPAIQGMVSAAIARRALSHPRPGWRAD
jgi:hypothetical protein